MTALENLCRVLSELPMDDAGRKEADALIAAARAEQAELVSGLRKLEWCRQTPEYEGEGSVFSCCPECDQENFRAHKPSCELAALLSRFPPTSTH